MLRSFRNQNLERLWRSGREVPQKTLDTRSILRVLDAIDSALNPYDVAFSGNRFDEWMENGHQRFGAMVSEHWLVSFSWNDGHALDVDLERID
jgi:plasmid maintenance system killer protein